MKKLFRINLFFASLFFFILSWSCRNNETLNQDKSIIQGNKVETGSIEKSQIEQKYDELLELAIDTDSIKVNGEYPFQLSKNYLIKIFKKPDSTSNNFGELEGYGTYETL